ASPAARPAPSACVQLRRAVPRLPPSPDPASAPTASSRSALRRDRPGCPAQSSRRREVRGRRWRAPACAWSGRLFPGMVSRRGPDASDAVCREIIYLHSRMDASTMAHASPAPLAAAERERLETVGFMTLMTLVMLGNYSQTGHFGGRLAYTPFNVAAHLLGPERGGLRYDYRRPKHPYADKFMLAAGHCAPTCYALWMIMGEALSRAFCATQDRRYSVAPDVAMLPVDALGFRRGAGALRTLLSDAGLTDQPLFKQAKGRGIRALSGHIESTDVTNDVNGGPSGIGIATAAGKAAFWDVVGARLDGPKVIAFEGEFAMCAGHAQELKTQAIALQVGKRLRIFLSDNNAGIDD